MTPALVAEVTRNGFVEGTHTGSVVVLDAAGAPRNEQGSGPRRLNVGMVTGFGNEREVVRQRLVQRRHPPDDARRVPLLHLAFRDARHLGDRQLRHAP